MINPLTERDYEIFIARCFGQSLGRIGLHHGISAERVRQIVAKCLRRLMKAERNWAAAERACARIQAECMAKRIEQWARIVEATKQDARLPVLIPPTFLTLDELDLPVRVSNILRNNGKETLEQICQITPNEFLRFRNAGRVSLRNLRDELDLINAPHNLGKAAEISSHTETEP